MCFGLASCVKALMTSIRKRKPEEELSNSKDKKPCAVPESQDIFDSDDDVLFMSQKPNSDPLAQDVTPTQNIQAAPSPPLPVKQPVKPVKSKEDRVAMSSDIDKIIASISGLSQKFGGIRKEMSEINDRVASSNVRIDNLSSEVSRDREEVLQVVKELDERIDGLAEKVEEDREAFSQSVREAVDIRLEDFGLGSGARPSQSPGTSKSGSNQGGGSRATQSSSSPTSSSYLLSRKSLHVWPLKSPSSDALMEYSREFLGINDEFRTFKIVSIAACRSYPNSKIRNEYTVLFASISERDCFRALASKLRPFTNREAGMRLALPDHLVATFKLLEHEGFRINQRRPGTKRSIKFDDISESLVMDIKLPGAAWVKITPAQVTMASRGRKMNRVPAVSEILNISAEDLPEPTAGYPQANDDPCTGLGDMDEEMPGSAGE